MDNNTTPQPPFALVLGNHQTHVIEFLTVRSNLREGEEKEQLRESGIPVDFDNKEDYMCKTTIDMDTVVDFYEGKTYFNGQELDCIYPNIYGNQYEVPLLCSPEVFRKIYEECKGVKIKSFEQWK